MEPGPTILANRGDTERHVEERIGLTLHRGQTVVIEQVEFTPDEPAEVCLRREVIFLFRIHEHGGVHYRSFCG